MLLPAPHQRMTGDRTRPNNRRRFSSGCLPPAGISAAVFLGGTLLITLWRMSRDPQRKRSKTINKNKVGAGCWRMPLTCPLYPSADGLLCIHQAPGSRCQGPATSASWGSDVRPWRLKGCQAAGCGGQARSPPQPAGSAQVCSRQQWSAGSEPSSLPTSICCNHTPAAFDHLPGHALRGSLLCSSSTVAASPRWGQRLHHAPPRPVPHTPLHPHPTPLNLQLVVDTISKYLPGNRAGMSGASFALLKMQTGAPGPVHLRHCWHAQLSSRRASFLRPPQAMLLSSSLSRLFASWCRGSV